MPTQHVLQVNARGLVTAPNPLLVPRDALITADNVVFERPGYIQSRRGFSRYTYGTGGYTYALAKYKSYILANGGGSAGIASNLKYNSSNDGTGAWSTASSTVTNNANVGERLHSAEALGFLYATSRQGVQRVTDSPSWAVVPAGVPKGLALDRYGPSPVLTGTGGFLTDGNCVAYRVVIGRSFNNSAGNKTINLGTPSGRTVYANATGTSGYSGGVARNVVVRVLLPVAANTTGTALDTTYFVQLYRSSQVANGQTPSDELQLVYEAFLTSGNISAGYVDVTDSQPDSLRGAYLYTNPNTGEDGVKVGILNGNEPPPIAADVAWWRNLLWYANTSRSDISNGRQRLTFQILGTGSSSLQSGDTLTIAGQTYTAIASGGTPSAGQFVVETAGTASANIEATANNLVVAINKNASNATVYAAYISGAAPDAPGKVLIEGRSPTGAVFTAVASAHGTSYAPSLGSALSSSGDGVANRLYFSKPGQPEAVPVVNFFDVGPPGSIIWRIYALGNQLYVLTSGGIYRVLGTDFTNFTVDPVDLTCQIAAPESVCALDGSVYFLSSQGAVEVTDGNALYISGDIDYDIRSLLQTLLYDPSTGGFPLRYYAFAVAHPLDHRVLFWLPASTSDTSCSYAYVFDRRARSWCRWYRTATDISAAYKHSCGVYSDNGPTAVGMTLASATSSDGWCFIENRTFTTDDYVDVNDSGTKISIKRSVQWAYQDNGDASQGKQWREVQLLFGANRPKVPTVTVTTEIQDSTGATETSSTTTTYSTPVNNSMHRLPVAQGSARAARMAITLASAESQIGFDVAGMALHFRTFGPRLTRGP
jgi:hypothetical protein